MQFDHLLPNRAGIDLIPNGPYGEWAIVQKWRGDGETGRCLLAFPYRTRGEAINAVSRWGRLPALPLGSDPVPDPYTPEELKASAKFLAAFAGDYQPAGVRRHPQEWREP